MSGAELLIASRCERRGAKSYVRHLRVQCAKPTSHVSDGAELQRIVQFESVFTSHDNRYAAEQHPNRSALGEWGLKPQLAHKSCARG